MELKKKNVEGVNGSDSEIEQIQRLTRSVFAEVLHAEPSNSMTTTPKAQKILWRPNNYRRKMIVKTRLNSGSIGNQGTMGSIAHGTLCKHTKIISLKNYAPDITLQLGKKTLTGIYSQQKLDGVKVVYLIEAYSIADLEKRIFQKKKEIEEQIDHALLKFAKAHKIKIPLENPVWQRYEDWVRGEDYIDRIPEGCIIHDKYFKKVYKKGIEFKGVSDKGEEPIVHMVNFIKNRALEDFSPTICDSINQAMQSVNPYRILKLKIKHPMDALRYPDIIRMLSPYEKKLLSRWLFTL